MSDILAATNGSKCWRRWKDCQWFYLGTDYFSLSKLAKNMETDRVNLSSAIRIKQDELRGKYLEWVKKNILARKSDHLLCQPTLSKYNISEADNVFQLWILIKVAEDLMQKHAGGGEKFLMVCENDDLYRILCRKTGQSPGFRHAIRTFTKKIKLACKLLRLSVSIAKQLISSCKKRKIDEQILNLKSVIGSSIVLVHTFYGSNSIGKDGKLEETYYPGLKDYLDAHGIECVFWGSCYGNAKPNEISVAAKHSGTKVFFGKHLLRFQDYCEAILQNILSLFYRYSSSDNDEKLLSKLATSSTFQAACYGNIYSNVLLASEGMRLVKFLKPNLFIFEFEGQPWEKLLVSKIKSHSPKVQIYGYQHAHLAKNLLSYYTDKQEISSYILPDKILINSPAYKNWFIMQGYPPEILIPAASLRYKKIIDDSISSVYCDLRTNVLVALPIEPSKALELLHKSILALSQAELQVIVKPHPMCRHEDIVSFLEEINLTIPINFSFSYDHISVLLKKSFVLLSIGSSVEIDALVSGVKVIQVGQECGTQYVSTEIIGIKCEYADTPEDIFKAVQIAKSYIQDYQIKELKEKVRSECFNPIEEKYLSSFLPE